MAIPELIAPPTSNALVSGDPAGADGADVEDREATRFEDIGVGFQAA
jgi:hypothetical protein